MAGARRVLGEATDTLAAATERARTGRAAADVATAGLDEATAGLMEAGVSPSDAQTDDPEEPVRADRRAGAIADTKAQVRALDDEVRGESARVEAEREQIARDQAERDAARVGLGPWGDQADPVAALTQAIAEAEAVERAADAAAAALTAASDNAARAGREMTDLERGPITALRTAAARAAERGRLTAPSDEASPDDLILVATQLRVTALAAAQTHAERAAEALANAGAARAALAASGQALGVHEPDQVGSAVRRLRGDRDAARARLAAIEDLAATARRLAAQALAARARAQLHHQVALDLRANAFPRFLLGRYRERLAREASAHLQALSAGAYRFSGREPDPMAVVDTRRGDRLRAAATLSGGERFLASLALALGLGDVAAESGGRLDCLFLDEGFSSLDAESLEQALAGVERLAGDGRLVAVITHLPGIADRLGAAIHVTKDPAGASRVVDTAAAAILAP